MFASCPSYAPTLFMKIILNDRESHIDEACFLLPLIEKELQLRSLDGIAVSVNYEVIPKKNWAAYQLKPGDAVLVIHATAGG